MPLESLLPGGRWRQLAKQAKRDVPWNIRGDAAKHDWQYNYAATPNQGEFHWLGSFADKPRH